MIWHGCHLYKPGWDDPEARALGFTLGGFEGNPDIHVMLNMYWNDLEFELPFLEERNWYKAVDTFEPSPQDIVEPGSEIPIYNYRCLVRQRSIVVLISR